LGIDEDTGRCRSDRACLVAHLATGAKENADLIEDALAGRPARPTRDFVEREAAFVAMPDAQLREELINGIQRKLAAVQQLSERGPDATYPFTGRSVHRFAGLHPRP
jgi:hypothetical protein